MLTYPYKKQPKPSNKQCIAFLKIVTRSFSLNGRNNGHTISNYLNLEDLKRFFILFLGLFLEY